MATASDGYMPRRADRKQDVHISALHRCSSDEIFMSSAVCVIFQRVFKLQGPLVSFRQAISLG